MRIEQRIGRIDRYGQKSEAVAIWNLVTPGTVNFEVYERCMLRIGVFARSCRWWAVSLTGRPNCTQRAFARLRRRSCE
jgi:hypothetical protein